MKALIWHGMTSSSEGYFRGMGWRWRDLFEALDIPCTYLAEPTKQEVLEAIPEHDIMVVQAHGMYGRATIHYRGGIINAYEVLPLFKEPILTVLHVCNGLDYPHFRNSWAYCLTQGHTKGAVLGYTDEPWGAGGNFMQAVCDRLVLGKNIGDAFDFAQSQHPQYTYHALVGDRSIVIGQGVSEPEPKPEPTPEPTPEPEPIPEPQPEPYEIPTYDEVMAFVRMQLDNHDAYITEKIHTWLESLKK